MMDKLKKRNEIFSVDEMIDSLDEIYGNQEKRKEFEQFYKSFVTQAAESAVNDQSDALKKLVDETEVFSLIIKEKSKEFDEIAKEIYAMGRFKGAYDAFGTWCKMYVDISEYEKTMSRILNKKHIKEILRCIRKQPGIQNKMILNAVNIKPNHLSELTSEMVHYQIISRYSIGKNVFYELTPRAKVYFSKKENREYRIRLNRQKINLYMDSNFSREHIDVEPKAAYFHDFIPSRSLKIRKEYNENWSIVLERSMYNV